MAISTKQLNTFGIDVEAKALFEYKSEEELIKFLKTYNGKWYVLGEGSNVLFTQNFDGVIIRSAMNQIDVLPSDDDSTRCFRVGAALNWDKFCSFCAENNLWGAENLSNIPGTVGASPVQNIGAYGVEACNVIESVRYIDTTTLKICEIKGSECNFGYRSSIFKGELRSKAIIISVDFKLSTLPKPKLDYGSLRERVESKGEVTIGNIRESVIEIRSEKLPDPKIIGNGGSFFKNPVVSREKFELLQASHPNIPHYTTSEGYKIPAAWLIDSAGWKGYRKDDAGVHKNQALVLVNYGSASGKEVLELSDRIIEDIKVKYDIDLEREINLI